MSTRPSVPINVERALWAEAIGHCMDPTCQTDLINKDVNIGDMAHIIPHAEGGDVSFDNLILLCKPCHTQIDQTRKQATIGILREYKQNRNKEIQQRFTMSCHSFKTLSDLVIPILKRNRQIFENYGPKGDPTEDPKRHQLWLKFESDIIANNRKLELILTSNKPLLHIESCRIIDEFIAHSHEFVATRYDQDSPRLLLFPQNLLSIFGLEESLVGISPNLSALQNLINYLQKTQQFVSLMLVGEPRLIYLDNGQQQTLQLKDRYRLQQVFWTGGFYKPNTTELRTDTLIFFLKWLNRNNIRHRFEDISDLTVLMLNDTQRVKLCYPYVLSLSDLHLMTLSEGNIVVNLYNWNGGKISHDAETYASEIGVQLFTQDEFFKFARRKLR